LKDIPFAEVYQNEQFNFTLIWISAFNMLKVNNTDSSVYDFVNYVKTFRVSKLWTIDCLNIMADIGKPLCNDCGLRVIAPSKLNSSTDHVPIPPNIPLLETGVVVRGLSAALVNLCEAEGIAFVTMLVLRQSVAFCAEEAKKLEILWESISEFISNANNKISLTKPDAAAYLLQHQKDSFLLNTDNLYT
jgi:hypothetical protein